MRDVNDSTINQVISDGEQLLHRLELLNNDVKRWIVDALSCQQLEAQTQRTRKVLITHLPPIVMAVEQLLYEAGRSEDA